MQPGSAALLSIDLYNRLLELPYSETAEIGRIAWRLRTARLRNPDDATLAVAHLQALTMIGDAQEALELAELVWQRRQILDAQTALSFGAQLKDLGLFERSLELLRSTSALDGDDEREVKNIIKDCVFWLGDVDLISCLDEQLRFGDPRVDAFLDDVHRIGFAPHFSTYQRLARTSLMKRQTACFSRLITAEGSTELTNVAFVRADRIERRRIEDEIDTALDDYYRSVGLSAGAHLPLINTVMLDTTAHGSDAVGRLRAHAEAIARQGE
jgi:hypothetical protein